MDVEHLEGDTLADRFELEELIGKGGYGAVFRAVQLSVERPCAVKILSPELCTDQNTVERFKNEARMTARLTHEHTVRIIDFGRDEDRSVIFLAMELLDGRPVKDRVDQTGPLSVDETLKVVQEAAGSLREAHERGMVHRDIKPHNIMLIRRGGDDQFVKVIDFGIAKALENELTDKDDLTKTGMMIGTPTYMAPEQIRAEDMDGRTDQYALAMTVYHMMTGRTPFQGSTSLEVASKHLTEPPLPLSSYRPNLEVPEIFDQVLLKALSKDKRERFETIVAFADALRAAGEGRLGDLEAVDVSHTAEARPPGAGGSGSGPNPQPESGSGTRVARREADGGGQPDGMARQTGEVADGQAAGAQSAGWGGSSQELVGPQDTADVPNDGVAGSGVPGGQGAGGDDWETAATQVATMDDVEQSTSQSAQSQESGVQSAQRSGPRTTKTTSKKRTWLIVGTALAVVLLVGGGGLGVYLMVSGPEDESGSGAGRGEASAAASEGGETDESVQEAERTVRAGQGESSGAQADPGESSGEPATERDDADERAGRDDSASDEADPNVEDEHDGSEKGGRDGQDEDGRRAAGGAGTDRDGDDGATDDGAETDERSGAESGSESDDETGRKTANRDDERDRGSGGSTGQAARPSLGSVRVIVIPWGRVFVGGRSLGESSGGPLETKLPIGQHTLVLKQKGEVKAKRSVRVRESGQAKVVLRAE